MKKNIIDSIRWPEYPTEYGRIFPDNRTSGLVRAGLRPAQPICVAPRKPNEYGHLQLTGEFADEAHGNFLRRKRAFFRCQARAVRRIGWLALAALLCASCGLKGPLTLPPQPQTPPQPTSPDKK